MFTSGVRVRSWSRNWPNMAVMSVVPPLGTSKCECTVVLTSRGFGSRLDGFAAGKFSYHVLTT